MAVDPNVIIKVSFAAWVVLGLLGFLFYGGYSVVDSLYLMAQIVTTVGYGDPAAMMPSTSFGYTFMICYVLFSVLLLAGFAGTTADSLLQGQEARLKQLVDKLTEGTRYKAVMKRHPGLRDFLRALLIWLAIVVVGIAFFVNWDGEGDVLPSGKVKPFSVLEALYMSVITLTTVGFGDKTPKTDVGKLFGAAWMLVGTVATLNMATRFGSIFLEAKRKYGLSKLDHSTLGHMLQDKHVKASQQNRAQLESRILEGKLNVKTGTIAKADFLLFMLKDQGLVQPSILDELEKNFDILDCDHSGYIDEKDLVSVKSSGAGAGSYSPPVAPA